MTNFNSQWENKLTKMFSTLLNVQFLLFPMILNISNELSAFYNSKILKTALICINLYLCSSFWIIISPSQKTKFWNGKTNIESVLFNFSHCFLLKWEAWGNSMLTNQSALKLSIFPSCNYNVYIFINIKGNEESQQTFKIKLESTFSTSTCGNISYCSIILESFCLKKKFDTAMLSK